MVRRPSVSRICFGCEPLGGSDWGRVEFADISSAVERALELGINFFDTADVYGLGLSELRLSEILGSRRHDVLIATKGGLSWQAGMSSERASIRRNSSPKYLQGAVEASLRRLRLDRLPIYFIHWPDPNTDIRATFECLTDLKDAGKIGWIGCSNFSVEQVRLASQVSNVSFVQLPMNILGEQMEVDMQLLTQEKDIDVVAYNVLANGLLTGKYGPNACFPKDDRRSRLPLFQGDAYRYALAEVQEFSTVAKANGLTCAQYAIAKVLRYPQVTSTILGIKNRQQIEENGAILLGIENKLLTGTILDSQP